MRQVATRLADFLASAELEVRPGFSRVAMQYRAGLGFQGFHPALGMFPGVCRSSNQQRGAVRMLDAHIMW